MNRLTSYSLTGPFVLIDNRIDEREKKREIEIERERQNVFFYLYALIITNADLCTKKLLLCRNDMPFGVYGTFCLNS